MSMSWTDPGSPSHVGFCSVSASCTLLYLETVARSRDLPSAVGWGRVWFGTFSLRGLAVLACGGAVLPYSGRAGTVTSSPSPAARLGSLVLTLIIPMARPALQLGNSKDPSLVHAYLCDITIVFFEIVHFFLKYNIWQCLKMKFNDWLSLLVVGFNSRSSRLLFYFVEMCRLNEKGITICL